MSNEKVAYVQKQTVITVDQVATLRGIIDKEKSMKTNDKETTFHAYLSQQLEEPHFREEYDRLQAAEAVAQAVIESGLTEEEIARRSGLNLATIRKLEKGTMNPSVRTLQALAKGLGCVLRVSFVGAEGAYASAAEACERE